MEDESEQDSDTSQQVGQTPDLLDVLPDGAVEDPAGGQGDVLGEGGIKALRAELVGISKRLEAQVAQTLPWERESRLDRVKSLTRDIESGNASEEEAFSRLKSLVAEETKFGDEVAIINSPLTRKDGELINAAILRIGNQWMVYSDDNGTVFGTLVRKMVDGKIVYEWNEDLNLEERAAVKLALDVKQAKKPPQVVKLPVSLSVVGGER